MILPENNRIPEKVDSIHLIAVCGTAMGALACMLKDMGYRVTGSDSHVYPPMSRFLEENGVAVMAGFDGSHLSHRPDLVVVGNAVSRDNAEVVAIGEMALCYCSMPQAVNRFAAAGKRQVLVAGTHGKTTTSAMLAWILFSAGRDPSFIIGGILPNFKSNYRTGAGDCMVIEADEYDTAFFDKGPKFLHYTPDAAILTSVEFDHADIYRDLDHVRSAFGRFLTAFKPDSLLVSVDDDPNVSGLVGLASCKRMSYGLEPDSSWRIGRVFIEPPATRFEAFKNGMDFGTFRTRMIGAHNLKNAISAVAVADYLGVPSGQIARALDSFAGVRRRQEIRGEKRGVIVMDDFAHHPTAVRETVKAVKSHFSKNRLVAVFEPRTNSSMRKIFQQDYATVFDAADRICIRKPPLLKKVPRGERFSSERLVADLRRRGKDAVYFEDTESIIDDLSESSTRGDVILIMSNGGFDNIHERLLKAL
ncbi:UDP-N-acetylmuramate:L-alanyl-gamma-D-glutamyl-me so-diaminopimelate ligase [Desulfosarcina alkanivorans]|uniref:UDP-N-acetylmuramate:L-alanyl-gamma-D-glutamyl-me so-diaminopimelate ligase n=1 Tax=Desulfosarcina alkanivorans TaxID=571177 RepID=A0A5K7YAB5_9BACT|nr:UDP-N-acetylmuramate:L-alanyl-gamma-D-glutamyl-meso-diaminopimelate ligase [Desulfosarcina alkanivorans]BBO66088.1 UDP-N-acetylmuramate:L-alanyl-gamma-D-glutamyl-me so-diaminopimelate ligase [Desulfosarcina alkanivorans]